jgi:hypothetical protein
MVEPLSIAASIGGLATLAGQSIKIIYKFVEEVKRCEPEVTDLLLAVSNLEIVLNGLSFVTQKFNDVSNPGS